MFNGTLCVQIVSIYGFLVRHKVGQLQISSRSAQMGKERTIGSARMDYFQFLGWLINVVNPDSDFVLSKQIQPFRQEELEQLA